MPKPFYRFVRMEKDNRTDLFIDGVLEAERPWWDDRGEVACPEQFREGLQAAGDGLLVVHLNSPGGDLTAGIAIFEMLRQHKGKTRCETTYAASAATLIPCGCDESLISPAGVMVIHNPAGRAEGDITEMELACRVLTVWKDAAIEAYKQRIKLTDEEISAMMSTETIMNAQAAVDIGLADGILEAAPKAAASMYQRQVVMQMERDSFTRMLREKDRTEEAQERAALLAWANGT